MGEYRPFKARVAGSIPADPTIKKMKKQYPFEGTEEWYSTSGPRRAILIINWEVNELVNIIKKTTKWLPLEKQQKLKIKVDKQKNLINQKLENLSTHLKIFEKK